MTFLSAALICHLSEVFHLPPLDKSFQLHHWLTRLNFFRVKVAGAGPSYRQAKVRYTQDRFASLL